MRLPYEGVGVCFLTGREAISHIIRIYMLGAHTIRTSWWGSPKTVGGPLSLLGIA